MKDEYFSVLGRKREAGCCSACVDLQLLSLSVAETHVFPHYRRLTRDNDLTTNNKEGTAPILGGLFVVGKKLK